MFNKSNTDNYTTVLEGIEYKTLTFGDKTLLAEFRLKKGKTLPRHSHPHEQTGYLVSGRISLMIEDDTFEACPGDSWSIAGGVEHSAEILEDTVAVEIFSPVRDEYLP